MNWITWSLLSAVFAGLTAIFAKVGVTHVGSNLATAIRTSIVLVLAWIIAVASKESSGLATLTARHWLFLTLSGLATGLSWLCYFRALQLGDASRVASIDKLSVVFVLIFAAIFLHEPMTWKSVCGVGLILGGAILLALK